MTQYRQGDVFLIATKIPKEAKRVKRTKRGLVLAEGEATGHAHAVRSQHAQLFTLGAMLYLRALREVEIEHEEHGKVVLPAGDYLVRRQKEYSPQEVHNVQD